MEDLSYGLYGVLDRVATCAFFGQIEWHKSCIFDSPYLQTRTEESLSRTAACSHTSANLNIVQDDGSETYLLLNARITLVAGVKRRDGNIALSACAKGGSLVGEVAAVVACHNILEYVGLSTLTGIGRTKSYFAERVPVEASQNKLEVADLGAGRGNSWEVDVLEGCYHRRFTVAWREQYPQVPATNQIRTHATYLGESA